MIKTVKKQENGYLVNNEMSVPNDPSNRHYIEIQKWILNGGIVESEFTFSELQNTKLSELVADYNDANTLDITYMDTTFQADKKSQDLIVSVLSAGSVPDGFYWMDKNNNQVAMTFSDLQGLSGAILMRGQANFVKLQGLKDTTRNAKSIEDIEAIYW